MTASELIMVWSDAPALSITIWLLLIIAVLYFARKPAHHTIRSFSRIVHNALRLVSRSVNASADRLSNRNREVLLAQGQEASERYIEREFHRVEAVVSRDLSAYPGLHRGMKDIIINIDEDYRRCAEVPPDPPEWTQVVQAIAKLPAKQDPVVGKILNDIDHTVQDAHESAMKEYRKASKERHDLLKKMMPFWRGIDRKLDAVEKQINGLQERSRVIDTQFERYEQIRANNDSVVRTLSSSSLTQFFISGIVLLIAVLGGFINFQLIALPMSEMVGGSSYLGPIKTSDVAALVIILIEIAMGLFLMESLHITRLFPVISSMDDKMRKRMVWTTFTILFVLAGVESALAYMRDLLAADREALTQSLSGMVVAAPEFRWIPSLGQMVMGFLLPFALTFVAIPLESFIHSSRTVLGVTGVGLLRAMAYVIRVIGNIVYQLGRLLVELYDLVIFIPLKIEAMFTQPKHRVEHKEEQMPALTESPEEHTETPKLSRQRRSDNAPAYFDGERSLT